MSEADYEVDAELLERWQAGDKGAGAEIYRRHVDFVIRFFRNKSGKDVDDLVQMTFVRLLAARHRVRDRKALTAFIHSIARNVLSERMRQNRPDFNPDVDSFASVVPGPSSILGRKQEHRLFVAALRHVPLEQQTILELFYWEHMNAAEIAELMGISHSAMRSRLAVAREAVKQQIAELGESDALVASTITGIDKWASEVRARFATGESAEASSVSEKNI